MAPAWASQACFCSALCWEVPEKEDCRPSVCVLSQPVLLSTACGLTE